MRVLSEETKNAVLEYTIDYQKQHGLSPSFRKIMHAVGLGSLATVQRYVKQLENEGRLSRTSIGNIAPLPQLDKGNLTLIPLIGEIACGEPIVSHHERRKSRRPLNPINEKVIRIKVFLRGYVMAYLRVYSR